MKVPARKRGNARELVCDAVTEQASMKVPARRRGNIGRVPSGELAEKPQ